MRGGGCNPHQGGGSYCPQEFHLRAGPEERGRLALVPCRSSGLCGHAMVVPFPCAFAGVGRRNKRITPLVVPGGDLPFISKLSTNGFCCALLNGVVEDPQRCCCVAPGGWMWFGSQCPILPSISRCLLIYLFIYSPPKILHLYLRERCPQQAHLLPQPAG